MKAYLNIHIDNLVLALPNGLLPIPKMFIEKYSDACQPDDYLIGGEQILLSKEPQNIKKEEARVEFDLNGLNLSDELRKDFNKIGFSVPLPITRIVSISLSDQKSRLLIERKLIQTNMVMPKNYLAQLAVVDNKKYKSKDTKSDLFSQPIQIGHYNKADQLSFDQLMGAYMSVKNADLLYAYHFHDAHTDNINEFYSLSEGAFAFLNHWNINLPKELNAPKPGKDYDELISWMKREYVGSKSIDNWSDYLLCDLLQQLKTPEKPDFTSILKGWKENETIRQLATKSSIDSDELMQKLLRAREDIRIADINFQDLLKEEYLSSDNMFPLRILLFLDMYSSKEAGNSANPASRLFVFMNKNLCKNRKELTMALMISGFYFGQELYANKEMSELYPHHILFLRFYFLNPLDKTLYEKLYQYCFDINLSANYLDGIKLMESKSSGYFKDGLAVDKCGMGNEFMNLVHYKLRRIDYRPFDETINAIQNDNLRIKNSLTLRSFIAEEFKFTGDLLSQDVISNYVIKEILFTWRPFYNGSSHDIKKLGIFKTLLDYYTYGN
jgi:hypothetical protein